MPAPAKKASKTPVKKTLKSTAKPSAPKPVAALKIGDKAPAVSLPGLKGPVRAADLKGKKVVLYFYPKDDTSGCTAQACAFQDNMAAFRKAGATVIGVSKDDLKSHEKFATKYKLGFNLASDVDTKVAQAYGSWVTKSMYGRSYMGMDRSTFLIDEKGKLRAIWRKVKVPGHVDEVLGAVKGLEKQ